ncbi:DUF3667 domain-containing protein [Sphingomonas xinjiangensis]|uniref:DUF3667 domain-containing protein n=1 Tax=Sphingomonas xinjiangensis TaxID=643568 RepID=A0A840YEK1_9SPHN|nr:DUF3667 domain-containing protein [Sphingomonas xinjiangensis]MBB5711264.1 hypothetical protein [Sphingomonas xinjiangensis]
MGGIEAAGELVTGGLLGRAMDHPSGGVHAGRGGGMCLNCGTALIGEHCHECGQPGHVHRSLHAVGHEIVHGVFHFEGKFWRTLPLLAWRPGDLTRRYIAGERARFVSPMAIFLFSLFAMFAVFSWAGVTPTTELKGNTAKPLAAIEEERKAVAERRDEAIKDRDKLSPADPDRADEQARIDDATARLKALEIAAAPLRKAGEVPVSDEVSYTGNPFLDHGIEKWQKNPSLMLYKLQSSGYKFSWLLIPLSLPFLWLLFFWRREYKLYDHAIFIIYSIAFMSLLFIVLSVASAVGVASDLVQVLAMIVPFVHITRQLQQAYHLGWPSAIVRAVILTAFIGIVLSLFVLILLTMGATG